MNKFLNFTLLPLRNSQGITIIEILIVITVIGTLVTIATTSMQLVREAERQALVAQLGKIADAATSFHSRTLFYPGDIPANILTTCTGNGNGDGRIGADGNANIGNTSESHISIGHLRCLNLINQQVNTIENVDFFEAEDKNAGFILKYYEPTNNTNTHGNYIVYAAIGDGGSDLEYSGGAISIVNARDIDKQMDDGVANTGRFITVNGTGCSFDTNNTGAGADYATGTANNSCRMLYRIN